MQTIARTLMASRVTSVEAKPEGFGNSQPGQGRHGRDKGLTKSLTETLEQKKGSHGSAWGQFGKDWRVSQRSQRLLCHIPRGLREGICTCEHTHTQKHTHKHAMLGLI